MRRFNIDANIGPSPLSLLRAQSGKAPSEHVLLLAGTLLLDVGGSDRGGHTTELARLGAIDSLIDLYGGGVASELLHDVLASVCHECTSSSERHESVQSAPHAARG